VAINGDQIKIGDYPLTAGARASRRSTRSTCPFVDPFTSLNLRPWYWVILAIVAIALFVNFRLRDSRLGRAWVALREDEVAAVSMGVPRSRPSSSPTARARRSAGVAGAFLGSYNNTVNADQFQFYFSILILGMVILGGPREHLGAWWSARSR
jgi:branched-chain amino acid transport system permease protein